MTQAEITGRQESDDVIVGAQRDAHYIGDDRDDDDRSRHAEQHGYDQYGQAYANHGGERRAVDEVEEKADQQPADTLLWHRTH